MHRNCSCLRQASLALHGQHGTQSKSCESNRAASNATHDKLAIGAVHTLLYQSGCKNLDFTGNRNCLHFDLELVKSSPMHAGQPWLDDERAVQAWELIADALSASPISALKRFAFVDVPYTNTQVWLFWSLQEKQVRVIQHRVQPPWHVCFQTSSSAASLPHDCWRTGS